MRRVDVDRMMASITALEFKEWQAYEMATGPIDGAYEREMLAELHELIQINNQLTGAAITKKGKKNPAGKFQRAIRAIQWFLADDEDDDSDVDTDDDDDDLIDEDYYEDDEEGGKGKPSPEEYDPARDPFAT